MQKWWLRPGADVLSCPPERTCILGRLVYGKAAGDGRVPVGLGRPCWLIVQLVMPTVRTHTYSASIVDSRDAVTARLFFYTCSDSWTGSAADPPRNCQNRRQPTTLFSQIIRTRSSIPVSTPEVEPTPRAFAPICFRPDGCFNHGTAVRHRVSGARIQTW